MSFPRYPAYKPSGVEWLGEVPEHWEVKPLKRVAAIQTGLAKGKEVEPEHCVEVPFLRVANVQDGFLDLEQMHTILIPEKTLDRYLLRTGDVLMNEGGDFDKLGRGAIWTGEIEPCIHQNHVFAVRPYSIRSSWLNAYTSSIQANSYFTSRSKQSTNLASISSSNLMELLVPVAPDDETTHILDFLDRETTKIDALIAEQKRLIELLEEKRQSVISHAVTKGLNPNAPMKDSGVEWLGEVPADWSIKRIKHLCVSIEQGWSPQCENESSDGEAPGVLKVGCVNGGVFRPSENKRLPPGLNPIPDYSVKSGDLLVSRANTKELVGSAAVAYEDFPWLYICDKLYRIIANLGRISSIYLALYLASNEARGQIELGASGASQSMQNISQSILLDLPIPVPHLDDQEIIRSTIAMQCCQIDELTAKALEAILLFKERRSVLISAAVTGQIDVGGLVPEAAEQ